MPPLLDETGVALTPGVDFDPERGHRFVRLSFAGPEADVATAARPALRVAAAHPPAQVGRRSALAPADL